MKIIAITQARYGSSRLPGKILKTVNNQTLLEIHLQRLLHSKLIDEIIVATTQEPESKKIIAIAKKLEIETYQGSLQNVLDRYYQVAIQKNPDYIVRITSDCPLIDAEIIDEIIQECITRKVDYASNTLICTYPDGLDVEIFTFEALKKAWQEATLDSDKEHVSPYIWKNTDLKGGKIFKAYAHTYSKDLSHLRITLDYENDFQLIKKLILELGIDKNWLTYVNYLIDHPDLIINSNIRNQMNHSYKKNELRNIIHFDQSNEYRKHIHDLIPGGAHTYSKGDDQFPILSPAAITHGKGCYVWDLDKNKYLDCSMGLSSVSLGHAYEPILDQVRKELEKGVNFQRPSFIEKEMAEKFLALIPQHDMIKFAKNGSTVTTAAVKLARAYTNRKLVAFPYDHPFYSYDDWFIGKTACNKGVPEEIASLSVTYKADDLNSLKELFEKYPNQIACVISEPERNSGIPTNYLKDAIDLAHKKGALYIVDEMITGFKTDFPGSIKKYNVNPDMVTWGKGIANGFAFCALTGKKEIMELGGIRNKGAEKVFLISTTHGAETHAMAAGLATIEIFKKEKVIDHNHKMGKSLHSICQSIITAHQLELNIELIPCDWMPLFIFKNSKREICQGMRTLFMQEMIKRGVLFQGIVIPSFSHQIEDIEYFCSAFEDAISIYKKGLEDGYEKHLIGEPAKPVFRKYI